MLLEIYIVLVLIVKNVIANEIGKVWGYDSHLAPEYWGKLHSKSWDLCNSGKQQSPIEILPDSLLFDPNLTNLRINTVPLSGKLKINGLDVTFSVDEEHPHFFNITGGPLSYSYKITDIKFHYGIKGYMGSEHRIGNKSFPAEVHLIGYNNDVYTSKDAAEFGAKGVVILAVFLQTSKVPNYAMADLAANLSEMRKTEKYISSWDPSQLLPNTEQFITYEGSFTQPGCQETVTWILFNKPVYITEEQLDILRKYGKGDWNYRNTRPVQQLNQRVVRTNINFDVKSKFCSMERKVQYKVNTVFHS